MSVETIIFDFDGTLVNSYQGIQNAFDYAFKEVYLRTNNINIRKLVGPPIKEILFELTREQDENVISNFATSFKNKYDEKEYLSSELYSDVKIMLETLSINKIKIILCTNKRIVPTIKMLQSFDLNKYFHKIYTLDSENIKFKNKDDLLNYIISSENIDLIKTLFVGDTIHDENASSKNNVPFVFAKYGFGRYEDVNTKLFINQPMDIFKYLT